VSNATGDVGSIVRTEVVQQFRDLGVTPGGVLLVHTAFSRVRPVEDGPDGLIAALREALGPDGTLAMLSTGSDHDQPFDPRATPCIGLGIVADSFWRLPGVLRSNSPHAFAAAGPQASHITAPHLLDVPHGLDSPVGRIYALNGQALLLVVGHDDNTTIHLAETLANVPYRRRKHVTVLEEGRVVRTEFSEIDHCCQTFTLADGWLAACGVQHVGQVGHGVVRLVRAISWRWSPRSSPRIRWSSSILRALADTAQAMGSGGSGGARRAARRVLENDGPDGADTTRVSWSKIALTLRTVSSC
jgi:aminoglycoside N3'-acetyltransferase